MPVMYNLGDKDHYERYRGTSNFFTVEERDILLVSGFSVDGFTACYKQGDGFEIVKGQKRNGKSSWYTYFYNPKEGRSITWHSNPKTLFEAIRDVQEEACKAFPPSALEEQSTEEAKALLRMILRELETFSPRDLTTQEKKILAEIERYKNIYEL